MEITQVNSKLNPVTESSDTDGTRRMQDVTQVLCLAPLPVFEWGRGHVASKF